MNKRLLSVVIGLAVAVTHAQQQPKEYVPGAIYIDHSLVTKCVNATKFVMVEAHKLGAGSTVREVWIYVENQFRTHGKLIKWADSEAPTIDHVIATLWSWERAVVSKDYSPPYSLKEQPEMASTIAATCVAYEEARKRTREERK